MGRPLALGFTRVVPFLPVAGGLALALALAGAASSAQTLACDRATGQCTWSQRSLFATDQRRFAIDAIREVRLVKGLGKNGRSSQPVLVFASGHELRLPSGDADDALNRQAALARLIAGQRDRVRDESASTPLLYLAAIAAAIAGLVLTVRAWRRRPLAPPQAAPRPTPPPRPDRRRLYLSIAAVGALLLVAQGILLLVSRQTGGTLVLDCQTRCRFQGGECLPGGSVELTLPPGDHTIEVWAAAGAALWTPRTVTIAVGERTRFVCAP